MSLKVNKKASVTLKIAHVRKFIYAHKIVILNLSVLFLLGLLPLTWFRGDFLIIGGDSSLPLFPKDHINLYFHVWWDMAGTGMERGRFMTTLPFMLFLVFSEITGLSLIIAEKILFYSMFTFSGLAMYYLTSVLTNPAHGMKENKKHITSLTAALVYMLNPYAMVIVWGLHLFSIIFLYAFLPLILALYIRGLHSKKTLRYYFLICGFSFLGCRAFDDPSLTFILWFVLLSYFVYYILQYRENRSKIVHAFQFTICLVTIWLLLNAWWIVPMAYTSLTEFKYATYVSNIEILKFTSRWASLFNVFRLQGYWAFYTKYLGDPLCLYMRSYLTIFSVLISFLFPLLAISAILFKPKNKSIVYMAFLSLIGIFLAKGSNPPLGEIIVWLISNFPIPFGIFRSSFIKLTMIVALGYAFLIGNSLEKVYIYLRELNGADKTINFKKKLVNQHLYHEAAATLFLLYILSSMCVVYVWPMWTGDVIYAGSKIVPSHRVKVPTYYYDANSWLNEQNDDFRVFILPFEPRAFDWNTPSVYSVFWLFCKSTISYRCQGIAYNIGNYINNLIEQNETRNIGKILALLNVKYILHHNDVLQEYCTWVRKPEYYQSFLNSQKEIHLERMFGKLSFYRNGHYNQLHIYAASNIILINGGLEEMMKAVESENFILGDSVLFLSDQLEQQQHLFIEECSTHIYIKPEIEFQKINPTKYLVYVNASEPFFLVFSESYNPQWVAYIDGKVMRKHFIGNGYANVWHIDKIGSYEIILEFRPQKLFEYSIIISLASFGFGMLILARKKFKIFPLSNIRQKNCIS